MWNYSISSYLSVHYKNFLTRRGGNGHTIKGEKVGLTQETLYKIALQLG